MAREGRNAYGFEAQTKKCIQQFDLKFGRGGWEVLKWYHREVSARRSKAWVTELSSICDNTKREGATLAASSVCRLQPPPPFPPACRKRSNQRLTRLIKTKHQWGVTTPTFPTMPTMTEPTIDIFPTKQKNANLAITAPASHVTQWPGQRLADLLLPMSSMLGFCCAILVGPESCLKRKCKGLCF